MYDMCIECLEMYHQKNATEETDAFIPIAIKFFNQIDVTGIDYGCMVGGYEPDKPHNSFYQIGDILIEINGQKIMTYDDIDPAKDNSKEYNSIKVLRFNGSTFDIVEKEVSRKEGKVLLYDMCEITEE